MCVYYVYLKIVIFNVATSGDGKLVKLNMHAYIFLYVSARELEIMLTEEFRRLM